MHGVPHVLVEVSDAVADDGGAEVASVEWLGDVWRTATGPHVVDTDLVINYTANEVIQNKTICHCKDFLSVIDPTWRQNNKKDGK